jgi:hypothetical protein
MLVDHKGGYLDESYLRLTEEEILEEYMKAEPFLTIDPNVREVYSSFCSAEKTWKGIFTSPKDIAPFHMLLAAIVSS